MSRPQPGIVNRPPQHLLLAALEFADRTPVGARRALAGVANVIERELRSDLDPPNADRNLPSAETGELGFDENFDRRYLTITLGFAATAFDALEVPPDQRPSDLRAIPWEALGDARPARPSGDLILQVCGDDVYVCEHVVRRVEEELSAAVRVVWTQMGSQRYTTRGGRTSRDEGRALIGFLDGTSNLSPRNDEADRRLVFVDPTTEAIAGYPQNPPAQPGPVGPYETTTTGPRFPGDLQVVPTYEPEWTRDGTYMVVRVSTFDTTPWDDQPQIQQETAIGRFKVSGASLDLDDDSRRLREDPAFAANQADVRVALNAHVRKANPRRSPEDLARRVFRRGYPLIESADGGMRRGLAFIAFARTTSTQFEFSVRAWLRNPDFPDQGSGVDQLMGALPEIVLGGGYYFVPAVRREPWTWVLPDAA